MNNFFLFYIPNIEEIIFRAPNRDALPLPPQGVAIVGKGHASHPIRVNQATRHRLARHVPQRDMTVMFLFNPNKAECNLVHAE